eukprot:GEZU01019010.1.p1 GENE.GEZU01019010.1~~GEZU01019010.1.p1  ORF type:complete len:230 (-),score=46.63 GEZU01019010.1:31-720(-)
MSRVSISFGKSSPVNAEKRGSVSSLAAFRGAEGVTKSGTYEYKPVPKQPTKDKIKPIEAYLALKKTGLYVYNNDREYRELAVIAFKADDADVSVDVLDADPTSFTVQNNLVAEGVNIKVGSVDEKKEWMDAINAMIVIAQRVPLFGNPLVKEMQPFDKWGDLDDEFNYRLPVFLEKAMYWLEQNATCEKGIFRVPGKTEDIKALKEAFNESKNRIASSELSRVELTQAN